MAGLSVQTVIACARPVAETVRSQSTTNSPRTGSLTETISQRFDYPEDVVRVRRVLAEHGLVVSLWTAERAWREHSAEMFAGWLGLPPDDDRLWACVESNARALDNVPHCSTCSCYEGTQ